MPKKTFRELGLFLKDSRGKAWSEASAALLQVFQKCGAEVDAGVHRHEIDLGLVTFLAEAVAGGAGSVDQNGSVSWSSMAFINLSVQ